MEHKWDTQLKKGTAGEKAFLKRWAGRVKKIPGTGSDYQVISGGKNTGQKLELKTDYHGLKTGNFFVERYSKKQDKSPGGPWKALRDGSEIFVFQFINDKCEFWFRTKELVEWVEINCDESNLFQIQNRDREQGYEWVTEGHVIKREKLMHLCKENQF